MQHRNFFLITWNGKSFYRKLLFNSPTPLTLKKIITTSNKKLCLEKKKKSKNHKKISANLRKLLLTNAIRKKAKNMLSNNHNAIPQRCVESS